MSEIYNKSGFNPGCIYRIALENFVTYKEVELFPGKSLNLIIGPNGTGKSTFVCAIILGLCGKPSAVGRDRLISTFIKEGSVTASIEIELYNTKDKKNIIIKRTFDKQDHSKWFIDYKAVTEKKVQEKIKSLNIQVDNLCQLLPQDKVQEFSALKPKDLLESTLNALGRYESIQMWKKLIELKNELVEMTKTLKFHEKELNKHNGDNESLKQKIEELNKRKHIKREIEICDMKLLWLHSQQLNAEVVEHEKEKKNATKYVKSNHVQIVPLKNNLEQLKTAISHLEEQKLGNSRKIQELKEQLKKCIKLFDIKENQLNNIDTLYEEKRNIHKTKERDLLQARMKLDKLKTDMTALKLHNLDESKLNLVLEEIKIKKKKVNADIEAYKKQRMEVTYSLDNDIRTYSNKIRHMENVQMKRLETLSRYKQDTYKALMWLRNNRDKFQHPVYEPMMLEINFTDPKFARYLESTVPAKDLIAFTFESTEDMNLFNRIMRNELKFKLVNAVCSQGGDFKVKSRDLRHLSYIGFHNCLLDTITAPSAILRYLCTQYRIHQIPIGNDHTYNNSDKVPEDISFFFTENHRFSVRVSAYGSKTSTTIEIQYPKLLANTVDDQELTSLNTMLLECQHKKQNLEIKFDSKLTDLQDKLQEVTHREKKERELSDKIKSTKIQIQLQEKKINALENEPTIDIEQEKVRCEEKRKEFVKKQCSLNSEMSNIMNRITKDFITMRLCMIKLNARRDEMIKKDADYRKLRNELQTATTKLEKIERNLKIITSKAQQKLDEVKKVCGMKLPTDPSSPYFEEFNALASNKEELQEYKNERLTKISFMEDIDVQALNDYENVKKKIESLTIALKTSGKTYTTKKSEINRIKSEWLPPLETLIEEISVKFAEMIKKADYAGEITLHKGNGDEDFSSYGVHLMVSFRDKESASLMTRHTQSGGERALCTAVYLLALQARAVAPFRCVDEINQGLDESNERTMLQLLIQETTDSSSQYFLLSPTLLPNLEYNEKVTVHTVMNGKHIMNHRQWNYDEFFTRARNGFN